MNTPAERSANLSFCSVLRSLQLDECASHLNKNIRKNRNTQKTIHEACAQHGFIIITIIIIIYNCLFTRFIL